MQIDLFNQALLLGVSFVTFLALVYGYIKNPVLTPPSLKTRHGSQHHKRSWVHPTVVIGCTLLFGLAARQIVQWYFPQDDIPLEAMVWAMPLGAMLVVLGYNIRFLRKALVCSGGTLFAVILVLLVANNYYHYYPTLGSIFDQNQYAPTSIAEASTIRKQTVFEQYYEPPTKQPSKGDLQKLVIPATGSFAPRDGLIYLPPALHGNDNIKLPVVVLLAGYPGKPSDWQNAGLRSAMDSFAAKHKGLAPIVAVVDFGGTNDLDTECIDSKLGAAETYLAKDVPTYLKDHYQVSGLLSDWTIAGYSAGGTCSTLVALRNPAIYRNYMNISGDTYPSLKTPEETLATLFNGSVAEQAEHTPNNLLTSGKERFETMNAWYFIGQQDKPAQIKRIKDQVALANKVGIEARLTIEPGHHSFLIWKDGFVKGLPWLMNKLRFTVSEK